MTFHEQGKQRGRQTRSIINHRPLAPAISWDQRALGEPLSYSDILRLLESAVEQFAPPNLQA